MLQPTGEQTALYDAVSKCLDTLRMAQQTKNINCELRLVILTDGGKRMESNGGVTEHEQYEVVKEMRIKREVRG